MSSERRSALGSGGQNALKLRTPKAYLTLASSKNCRQFQESQPEPGGRRVQPQATDADRSLEWLGRCPTDPQQSRPTSPRTASPSRYPGGTALGDAAASPAINPEERTMYGQEPAATRITVSTSFNSARYSRHAHKAGLTASCAPVVAWDGKNEKRPSTEAVGCILDGNREAKTEISDTHLGGL